MSWRRWVCFVVVLAVLVGVAVTQAVAGEKRKTLQPSQVLYPTRMDVSPELRTIVPKTSEAGELKFVPNKPEETLPVLKGSGQAPEVLSGDLRVQTAPGAPNTPAPDQNWLGIGGSEAGGYAPPDTTGDVGPNHYVQWVNVKFSIFNKTGTKLYGPALGSTLWAGFGGDCSTTDDGDIIVVYDQFADRWMMSQFVYAFPGKQCIAVSQTADPLGAWFRYEYTYGDGLFNDYPKLSVWRDGYYMSARGFPSSGSAQIGVMAFDRDKMLIGAAAGSVYFNVNTVMPQNPLPAHVQGTVLPPAGAPCPFATYYDDSWGNDADYLQVCTLTVNWTTPALSHFDCDGGATADGSIDVTALGFGFDSDLCGYARECIVQPSPGTLLDSLAIKPMYRLNYRNFGTHESMTFVQSVDAGSDRSGVRWWDMRQTDPDFWTVHDGGTFAPADGNSRWMGASAYDVQGNIAIGYSISGPSTNPSVGYATRLAGDAAGTMTAEQVLVAGGGVQTFVSSGQTGRWGDYSTMTVDPVDECTFWFTQEYYSATSAANWATRIGSFKIPTCSKGPTGTVQGTVTSGGGSPLLGATVHVGAFTTTTNSSGLYQIAVAPGDYDVYAEAFGYTPSTPVSVNVVQDETDVVDIVLTSTSSATVDGYVTDLGHGFPVYSKITITRPPAVPVAVLYTSAWSGYYEVTLPIGYTYDFTVEAMVPYYKSEVRPISVISADQTQSFALAPASGNPGYGACKLTGGINEDFTGDFPPEGWTVANLGGACVWEQGIGTNLTGGAGTFALADSDACGSGSTMNTTLTSPVIDLTGKPSVGIQFKYDYYTYGGGASQTSYVEVSNDGGTSWTIVKTFSADDRGPKTLLVDVTAQLANQANARIRFRFGSTGWWGWWQVDDVQTMVPSPPPPAMALNEGFESTTFPPTGWALSNVSGANWLRTTVRAHSGTASAYHNDDSGAQDSWLIAPAVTVPASGQLKFWEYTNYPTYYEEHSVWICIASCATPPTNFSKITDVGSPVASWREQTISLSSYASQSVTLAWRYTGDFADEWYVDDVTVGAPYVVVPPTPMDPTDFFCPSLPGTVVAGFVNDGNDLAHFINGATVANVTPDAGGGAEVMTVATPDDPALTDGFYWIFTPLPPFEGPSTRTFEASMSGFSAVTKDILATPNTVNRLDFTLESGLLIVTPEHLRLRVTAFGTGETGLNLDNQGGLDVAYTLIENSTPPAVFAPYIRADNRSPWRAPRTEASSNEMDRPGTLTATPEKGSAPTAWGTAATIPGGGRYAGAGVSCDGDTYYVLGGDPTGSSQTNQVWHYDPATDSWASKAPMPTAVTNVNGACIDGIIYLVGGYTGAYSNVFQIYDTAADSWTASTWPRSASPAVAAFDGKLYTFGGAEAAGNSATTYMFDPGTGTWNGPLAPVPTARSYAVAATVGDFIYVAGGWGLANVERYDPATDSWSAGPSLPAQRQRAFAAWYGDYLYVGGGGNGASWTSTSDVWYLDPATWPAGTWTATDSLSVAALGTQGACVNNRIYEAAGVGAGPAVINPHQVLDKGFECGGYALPDIPWLYENPFEGIVGAHMDVDVAVGFETPWAKTPKFGLHLAQLKIKHDTAYTVPNVSVAFTKAFKDVADDDWGDDYIHGLAGAMITFGVPGGYYLPDNDLTRAEMAVFLIRGVHGPLWKPPSAIGIFNDVTPDHWAADYIEQLYTDEITTGCIPGVPNNMWYCPEESVTRAQMAVFIVRAVHGPGFVPPAAVGIFPDVPVDHWAAAYIEQQYNDGITTGCGGGLYCPENNVTRREMAVFLVRGFNIPYLQPLP